MQVATMTILIQSQSHSLPLPHTANTIPPPRFNTAYHLFTNTPSRLPFSSPNHLLAYGGSEADPNRKKKERPEEKMTIKPAVRISSERKLVVRDRTILADVPENVVTTSAAQEGFFLGVLLDHDGHSHEIPLGTLQEVRFLACFRVKLWWMAQRMGTRGRDIPLETQFLLIETNDKPDPPVYTVFLPLVDGLFKACLQGNERDVLELCLDSGDEDAVASSFAHAVYVSSGTDPFTTVHDAIRAVRSHLGTFRLRDEKRLPGIVDCFGWCTWDAFYQEVTQEGVSAGLKSLVASNTPPKFVIIDDGWQSVGSDRNEEEYEKKETRQQQLLRLTSIKENSKFQKEDDPSVGIKNIVEIAKKKHGLKYVYVWHAITGYWGGVRLGVKEMDEYGPTMQYPKLCKGVMENEPGWKTDAIAIQGLGLVNPENVYKFYDDLHSYLSSCGVDGVKVDVQCILETLGAGLGGRVELTRQYHQALDASVAKNFPDNGCIACMSHNLESLYCSKQTAIVRASDDFYPRDPMSHTIHIAAVAYNSVFLGEIMLPDWDMFHSLHPAAEYHGSARAISGGPVYVSDAPGRHNFDLLRKLVLPDGSILRARLPGRPTKDCLFSDPSRDGVSLLKIWNMNMHTGVLGVYNCQGAAWNRVERKNTFHPTESEVITCHVRGRDVHLIGDVSLDADWDGDVALYSHRDGRVIVLPHDAAMPVSLKVLEHEIFTVTPIGTFGPGLRFAPFGLVDMFNTGGAIKGLGYEVDGGSGVASMEVMGCGRFGAYSSTKPRKCAVGGDEVGFEYDFDSGLVTLNLSEMPREDKRVHSVVIEL